MITKATSFLEGHKEDTKVNERWWLAVKILRQFISSFPNLEENLSGKKTLTILFQTFSGPKFIQLVDTNFYPLKNIWIFAFPTFLKGLELYNMYWWKKLAHWGVFNAMHNKICLISIFLVVPSPWFDTFITPVLLWEQK